MAAKRQWRLKRQGGCRGQVLADLYCSPPPRLRSPGRRPNLVSSGGLKPRRHGEKTKVKCWTTFLLTGDLLISRCWKEHFSQSIFCFFLSVPHSLPLSDTSVLPPRSPWSVLYYNCLFFASHLVTRTRSDLWLWLKLCF